MKIWWEVQWCKIFQKSAREFQKKNEDINSFSGAMLKDIKWSTLRNSIDEFWQDNSEEDQCWW